VSHSSYVLSGIGPRPGPRILSYVMPLLCRICDNSCGLLIGRDRLGCVPQSSGRIAGYHRRCSGAACAFRLSLRHPGNHQRYRVGYARPFEPFGLSHIIPKFMAPAATNLAVTFMCVAALGLLIGAIAWRYFHHRKTIELLRSKGITDFDGDGRTDNFASKFLDDL
jgi:hypothetical protein